MRKIILIITILFLASLVLIGGGCGKTENGDNGVTPKGGGEKVPTSDVAGKDISDVPRYPGSARVYYGPVSDTGIIVVEYSTSASIDTVSDFYEAQLPANGWVSPTGEANVFLVALSIVFSKNAFSTPNALSIIGI